jgi:murein L,D-transpeptidase YcbB/YkuD
MLLSCEGNFEVLDARGGIVNPDSVDWKKINKNNFPFILRQREGADNSLGLIKFMFHNPYAVYLHDTNAKRLFRHDRRAFSHGCIRIEKAFDLAHYLATGNTDARSKTLDYYLKQKKRHTIDLQKPIPIYVRYFTCEYKNDSFFHYEDVYGRDQQIYVIYP